MAKTNPSLPVDFVDLLTAFADAEVRYLLIGGYAVGYHDRPRTTKDLDLFVDPSPENMERVCRALDAFGAPEGIVEQLRGAAGDEIVWMGRPPARVDFLKSVPGVDFDAAWNRRVMADWQGVSASIIGREDLIRAKRAAGRDQDLVDARNLERTEG